MGIKKDIMIIQISLNIEKFCKKNKRKSTSFIEIYFVQFTTVGGEDRIKTISQDDDKNCLKTIVLITCVHFMFFHDQKFSRCHSRAVKLISTMYNNQGISLRHNGKGIRSGSVV